MASLRAVYMGDLLGDVSPARAQPLAASDIVGQNQMVDIPKLQPRIVYFSKKMPAVVMISFTDLKIIILFVTETEGNAFLIPFLNIYF